MVVVGAGDARTVLDDVLIAIGRSDVLGLVVVIRDAGTSTAVVIVFDNRRSDIGGFFFINRYVAVIGTGSGGGGGGCVVVDTGVQFNHSFIGGTVIDNLFFHT